MRSHHVGPAMTMVLFFLFTVHAFVVPANTAAGDIMSLRFASKKTIEERLMEGCVTQNNNNDNENDNENEKSTTRWANGLMKSWQKHADPLVTAQNTQRILGVLLDACEKFPELEPDNYSYGHVVQAWVHHATTKRDTTSLKRAQDCLQQASNRQKCSRYLYQQLFRGFLEFPTHYNKALTLLQEMKDEPDEYFSNRLGFVLSNKRNLSSDALHVLEAILRELERHKVVTLEVRVRVRKNLIFGHVQHDTAMSKVLQLLHEWYRLSHDRPRSRPNTTTLNQFISVVKKGMHPDAFMRAETLLRDMHALYNRTGHATIRPDQITYNSVLAVLARSTDTPDAGTKAEQLLQEMWDGHHRDNKGCPKPDAITYSSVMQSWCASKRGDRVEWLLRDMLSRGLKPSNIHYNQVLSALEGDHAADKADALLQEMWADPSIQPCRITYNSIIRALSTNAVSDAGPRAERMLQEMWDLRPDHPSLKPCPRTYSSVIQCWCVTKRSDAGDRAEALLRDMWDRYDAGDKHLKPRNIEYNQVISALSAASSNAAVARSEALLREMWNRYHETGDQAIRPDQITYVAMLGALFATGDALDGGKRTDELLQHMWQNRQPKPAVNTYRFLLKCWSTSKSEDAGDRAEKLLWDMWNQYNRGNEEWKPTVCDYNKVIVAICGATESFRRGAEWTKPTRDGEKVERLLQEMWHLSIKPDSMTYSHAIQFWSKSNNAEHAERLLQEMWDRYHEGDLDLKPSHVHYNQVIFALSHAGASTRAQELLREMWERHSKTRDESIKPDQRTYSSVVVGLSNSDETNAGGRAEELLQEMWDLYHNNTSQNEHLKPNAIVYGSVIRCWAKCRNAASAGDRAEALLRDMWSRYKDGDKDLKPSNIHYGQVISSMGGGSDVAAQGEALVQEMMKQFKPITYDLAMNALSKSSMANAGKRAEALLQEMWDLYDEDRTENESLKPNAIVYSAVIHSWSKSSVKNAGDAAERLLRDMWDRYERGDDQLKPSNIQYNLVISAVGKYFASGDNALSRAEALLHEMWNLYHQTGDASLKPNRTTYTYLLAVVSRSKRADAGERAEQLLREMWEEYTQGDPSMKPTQANYNQVRQVVSCRRSGDEIAFSST